MFGLFDSDVKRVRRLRVEFEDIRQRVLCKMNGYEQYSFGSAYETIVSEIENLFENISDTDFKSWLRLADKMRSEYQQAWRSARSMGGIAGEGSIAGAEALALLSLRASANGYAVAEAKILQTDIASFETKIIKFMNERKDGYDMIPIE